jgi:hypothetical protein
MEIVLIADEFSTAIAFVTPEPVTSRPDFSHPLASIAAEYDRRKQPFNFAAVFHMSCGNSYSVHSLVMGAQ